MAYPRKRACSTEQHDPESKRLRQEPPPKASLLGIPQELRDRIYELTIPFGNIHINFEGDSYDWIPGKPRERRLVRKGKGLTRKHCKGTPKEDDHADGRHWIKTGSKLSPEHYVPGYDTRHAGCLYRSYGYREEEQAKWPYGLLFVCRQTAAELGVMIYQQCSFSFNSPSYLEAFASRIPGEQLAHIRDIRLGLRMGSGGDDLWHCDPKRGASVSRRFTGLRSLHATLDLRFYDVRHLREVAVTDWKLAHWARGLLNFACHALEDVTIVLSNEDIIRHTSVAMLRKHDLSDEELRVWAVSIRDQLLAPWDPNATLEFLQKHYKEEKAYHRRVCGSHWDFAGLAEPVARIS